MGECGEEALESDGALRILIAILLYWAVALLVASRLSKRIKGLRITPFMIMYRREAGFCFLDCLKEKKWFRALLVISIFLTGLAAVMFYFFILGVALSRLAGESGGGLVPIIPGLTIKGEALLYIIVNIGIGAAVHELAHAAASKAVGVPLRSTGALLAVVIPGAFVEPDEEAFNQASLLVKAKILSAGPASNFVLALALLLLLAALTHASSGVQIMSVEPGSPAWEAGLKPGFTIQWINDTRINTIGDLQNALEPYRNSSVTLVIKGVDENGAEKAFIVHKPATRKLIGITVRQAKGVQWMPDSVYYTLTSFTAYGYLVNVSLAMINAAPLFITDGGRMLGELLRRKLGDVKGGTLNFFIQILTVLLVLSSITLRPL